MLTKKFNHLHIIYSTSERGQPEHVRYLEVPLQITFHWLFCLRISRTPPPSFSSRQLLAVEAGKDIWRSKQERNQEKMERGGEVFVTDMQQSAQVQVVVQDATPAHNRNKSLKSQSSVDDTMQQIGRRGSLDPQDLQRRRIARMSSNCSVTSIDSNDYYTPCGSFSEEDLVKLEREQLEEAKEKELLKKQTGEKQEKRQERPKSPCHNCTALRRQLSHSEDEMRKLKKQLSTRDERREAQVTELKEELFQREVEHIETLDGCKRYIFELEEKVYSLKLRVQKEQVAKQDALNCVNNLLHMAETCSSQLPPCSPFHHPPTHCDPHAHHPPTHYEDHAHHPSTHYREGHFHFPPQTTLGGHHLAQTTSGSSNTQHRQTELGGRFWNGVATGHVSQSSERRGERGEGEEGGQGETSHTHNNNSSSSVSRENTIHISQASEFV